MRPQLDQLYRPLQYALVHSFNSLSVCLCFLSSACVYFSFQSSSPSSSSSAEDYPLHCCTTEPHQLCECECCLYSTVVLFSCAVCVEEEDATHYITSLLSLHAQVFCLFLHSLLLNFLRHYTCTLVGASHSVVFCFFVFSD